MSFERRTISIKEKELIILNKAENLSEVLLHDAGAGLYRAYQEMDVNAGIIFEILRQWRRSQGIEVPDSLGDFSSDNTMRNSAIEDLATSITLAESAMERENLKFKAKLGDEDLEVTLTDLCIEILTYSQGELTRKREV